MTTHVIVGLAAIGAGAAGSGLLAVSLNPLITALKLQASAHDFFIETYASPVGPAVVFENTGHAR